MDLMNVSFYQFLKPGFSKGKLVGTHCICSGFGYNDDADDCDCKIIEYTAVCGKNDPSTGAANEGN